MAGFLRFQMEQQFVNDLQTRMFEVEAIVERIVARLPEFNNGAEVSPDMVNDIMPPFLDWAMAYVASQPGAGDMEEDQDGDEIDGQDVDMDDEDVEMADVALEGSEGSETDVDVDMDATEDGTTLVSESNLGMEMLDIEPNVLIITVPDNALTRVPAIRNRMMSRQEEIRSLESTAKWAFTVAPPLWNLEDRTMEEALDEGISLFLPDIWKKILDHQQHIGVLRNRLEELMNEYSPPGAESRHDGSSMGSASSVDWKDSTVCSSVYTKIWD